MRRCAWASVILLCLLARTGALYASGIPPGDARAVVNTGHRGAVLAMESDETRGLLFTAGEDGTVRVWDLASRVLSRVLRVGHTMVSQIALDPASPLLAALETDGVRSFSISEWDWETGELVFRIPVEEEPLFLRYSGGGSYLVYGVSRWEGLRIAASSDGHAVPFHSEGFGIVSFAEISRTEKTIMTYQPGGRISYWDLATGNLIRELRGLPLLPPIRITRDRRFLLGSTGREVLLMDLLSGAARARVELPGASSLDVSAQGDEIAVCSGAAPLSRWTVAEDRLVRQEAPAALPAAALVRYAGNELFIAQEGGALYSVPQAGEPVLVSVDELADVTGIAAQDDLLAVASSRWIWMFRTLGAAWDAGTRPQLVENPLKAPAGLAFLKDGRLVIWTRGDDRGAYGIMDPKTGAVTPGFGGFTGPLVQVQPAGDRLLTLEKSGLVRIFALDAAAPVFQVWSPGVNRLAMLSPRKLVGGRSAPEGDGSLISIDMDTGETVIVAGRNPFAYDLLYDPARKLLYSLQVDASGNTVLLANSGKDLEQQFSVMEYPGEDLNASIVQDPSDGRLYSSLGFDRIMRWDGTDLAPIPASDQVPRRLAVRGGLLYSLNRNSTVSIWDTSAGRFVGDMYFFPSGEWCVLFPDGGFASSEGAARMVHVFEKNGAGTLERDRYRVRVSGQ